MRMSSLEQPAIEATPSVAEPKKLLQAQVIACIDDVITAQAVIPHAFAAARALDSEVVMVHVLETTGDPHTPADPVEWDIRRHEAQLRVEQLTDQHLNLSNSVSSRVLEGSCAEQVGNCIQNGEQDITVFCRRDDKQRWHIGSTARKIIERCDGSVMIVPFDAGSKSPVRYKRLIVPLDGSAQAENAIPTAAQIASDHNAQLLLVKANPDFSFNEAGPLDTSDEKLQEQVNRRNQLASQAYLDKVRQRLECNAIQATTKVINGKDTKHMLIDLSEGHSDDMIVFTSHGYSGLEDVPMGSIAGYLLTRTPIPALMIRTGNHGDYSHLFSDLGSYNVRLPEGTQF